MATSMNMGKGMVLDSVSGIYNCSLREVHFGASGNTSLDNLIKTTISTHTIEFLNIRVSLLLEIKCKEMGNCLGF